MIKFILGILLLGLLILIYNKREQLSNTKKKNKSFLSSNIKYYHVLFIIGIVLIIFNWDKLYTIELKNPTVPIGSTMNMKPTHFGTKPQGWQGDKGVGFSKSNGDEGDNWWEEKELSL